MLEELISRGWQLGGEGSGHLLVLDRHTTGDGIVSALQVLQALRRGGGTLAGALREVNLFPQTLLNVRLAAGIDWRDHAGLAAARREVETRTGQHRPRADPSVRHRTGVAHHGRSA